MEYRTLEFEKRGAIGLLTLNRPDRLNALNRDMIGELLNLFGKLADDLDTRVVIIAGKGRAFCAGVDLAPNEAGLGGGLDELGPQGFFYKLQKPGSNLVLRMHQVPQPIIGAVRGPAVGGGFSLAMACDVLIATPSARFGAAFAKIGFSCCDMGSSYFLPRAIGRSRASEYLMTGRFMDAETADRLGLVSRVVPEDDLEPSALDLAEEMLRVSPLGLRMTKEVLGTNVDAPSLESAVNLENRTQALCFCTEDAKEGPRAFLEKRLPVWRDR